MSVARPGRPASAPPPPAHSPDDSYDALGATLDDLTTSFRAAHEHRAAHADASADEPVVDPLIGLEVAERYRILEQLGRGGMGIVYCVEHTRIGKLLAMKLLTGELSMNKEIVRRFKQEALTVSKLSSPHTVQVFDYGVWNHLTYLVMELVEGHHLAQVLKREGPMPFARLGPLMVQTCAALAEAHDKGIVHRDVKPENIMITPDVHGGEAAKVLDFGLAKLRENPELNAVTLQGAVVGTPYFLSPEQVTGDEVDGRSDIYSLGAVMFHALTGSYPFQAKTPIVMFSKHISEPAPSAIERAPAQNIPPRISDLVQRCMAKSPDDRPANVNILSDMLATELEAMGLETSDQLHFQTRRSKSDLESAITLRAAELAQQHATREELENYETRLRRSRYGNWLLGAAAGLAAIAAGAFAWQQSTVPPADHEQEPNNTAAAANPLLVGTALRGQIGRRLSPKVGDRDVYVFNNPPGQNTIALHLTALPNIPLCMSVYRAGYAEPLATYCGGAPGLPLHVAPLRLAPGRYFIAVAQDMWGDTRGPAWVLENVSDRYQLLVEHATTDPLIEVEPNDTREAAWWLPLDEQVAGSLGWVGDVDVLCVSAGKAAKVAWEIRDDKRAPGAVLAVTPIGSEHEQAPVRVHAKGARPFGRPRFEADVNSPWRSPILDTDGTSCVRLTLSSDPWATSATPASPLPGTSRYHVRAHIVADAANSE